jgi:16S rRNA (cytidine1402-2'-O)-methyltransferase
MKPATLLGKLYLIPTTMGDCDPMDVLPQTVKKNYRFHWLPYWEWKTARKSIKEVHPKKNNQN